MSGWIEIINTDISTPFTGAVMDDMVFTTALSNQRICFASGSNTVPVMTVSNNQVGIGTMTPQATIHVAGSAYFTSNMTIGQNLIMRGMQIERRDVAGPYNITTRITNVEGFSNTGGTIAITASNGSNINISGVITTTNQIQANTADTVTVPGYSWSNDTNTGVYHIGMGQVGVACAGSQVIAVATTGVTVIGVVDATNLKQGGVGVVLTTGGTISGAVTVNNTLTATSLAGNGAGVSNLNASYIASGTVSSNWLPSGSTTQTGIVRLEDSTSSTSTTLAATANAVKSAYDLANGALPKTGGTVSGVVTVNNTLTATTLQQGGSNVSILFAPSNHTHSLANTFITGILPISKGGTNSSKLPCFCVSKTTFQTLPNATFTLLTWNQKEFDTDAYFSTSTSRFAPGVAGYYLFTWNVLLDTIPVQQTWNTDYITELRKNGSYWAWGCLMETSILHWNMSTGTAIVYLNGTTDYVDLWVKQTTGASLNCSQDPSILSRFSGFMVRAQ